MDNFFGNWLDDSVIREDENGNRYIKRFTPGKAPVEVAVSADCKAAFSGQGYGEVHELREISKEEYETYGVKWGWGADPWHKMTNKTMKTQKVPTIYEMKCETLDDLIILGVKYGIIPEEEKEVISAHIRTYYNEEVFWDPTDKIEETEKGFRVQLTLKGLEGLVRQYYNESKRSNIKAPEITAQPNKTKGIPKELDTPKAKEILQRCIDSGHLDNDFQRIKGTTKGELYYIALYTSLTLWGEVRWKPFERLWSVKELRKVKTYEVSEHRKESIDNLFSKDVIERALKL